LNTIGNCHYLRELGKRNDNLKNVKKMNLALENICLFLYNKAR